MLCYLNIMYEDKLPDRTKTLLDCIPVPIMVFILEQGNGFVPLYPNLSAQETFRMKKDIFLGSLKENLLGKIHPEDRQRIVKEVLDYMDKHIEKFETTYRTLERSTGFFTWYKVKVKIKYMEDGNHLAVASFYNIKEELLEYADYRELVCENISDLLWKDNQKEFFSNAMHHLKTPMNAILNYAEFGKNETDSEKKHKYFLQISHSASFLNSIINNIMTLKKENKEISQLNPIPQKIDEIFSNIITLTNHRISDYDLKVFFRKNLKYFSYCIIDADRLEQMVVALVDNAINFTPDGGKIYIDLSTFSDYRSIGYLIFTIVDNGIGMENTFLKKIFQPFAQENPGKTYRKEGFGFGLVVVNNLIKLMNGEISIHSKKGIGTSIRIKIPIKKISEKGYICEKNKEFEIENILKKARLRVLCAEDNTINRKIINFLLNNLNCETVLVEDGLQCLENFKKSKENYFDIILMDIIMPKMDGIKASTEIRKLSRKDAKKIPIIAISANISSENEKSLYEIGINYSIQKPIEKKILMNLMYKIVQKDLSIVH